MYSHLLVPVDESMLSVANVRTSVELARQLGARITFFHATSDFGATSDGGFVRLISPAQYGEAALGATNAVLSKAAAAAAGVGVDCETVARVCDRPAEAIIEAALAHSCDLIVMASRGTQGMGGWLHSSQTERVLRRAPMALLVTRVEANSPMNACERALSIIQDEHRSIAAVVRGMKELAEQASDPAARLDLNSLDRMVVYLQEFPLQQHHPKEELYLHRQLRLRFPECDPLLKEIEAQHAREHELVAAVKSGLELAREGGNAERAALLGPMCALTDAVWNHIGLEERSVLPAAREHLLDEDWRQMAEAFESNNDPGFGDLPPSEFRRLFTRIANLLPSVKRQA